MTAYSFRPTQHLLPLTTYTIRLTSAIRDFADNPLAPVTSTFTTAPDASPPALINRSPLPDDTDVPLTASVIAQFSEHVVGLEAGLQLHTGGVPVAATLAYTQLNALAVLSPDAPLAPGTVYTVTLTGITDPSGNPLAPATWSFTTLRRP